MRVFTILLSLLFISSICVAQQNPQGKPPGVRNVKTINSGWTFNYFTAETADKGYELPGVNDSRWPVISLPHTWSSYETTGEFKPFTRSPGEIGETFWWTGWGWYRKHFSLNTDLTDRKLFIEFEGVQKYCKVWINGKYAGDHKGGYGSFDMDITDLVNPEGDNLIAVAVSYLQKDEFKLHPVSDGMLNASCGIYRNVRLVLKNTLYIPMQGSALHEGGTFITSREGSGGEGEVNVRTWVKNDGGQTRNCTLQTTISDRNNKLVGIIKTDASIEPGKLYMFDQSSGPLKNPHLWSPEDPYLYIVTSEVIEKKVATDILMTSFGFRWLRKEEQDNSVYMNDKKIELRGVIRHQEYPWLGDALPGWMTEMECSGLKGKGHNFLQIAYCPGDEALFSAADKNGIITGEDFSGISQVFSPEEQKNQLREMIRRDRNHPGIISWGNGNLQSDTALAGVIASEDNSRISGTFLVKSDTPTFFSESWKITGIPADSSIKSEVPARIIVKSLHRSIPADRGSVTILTADITDSKGNQIKGAENCVRWKVSGPGKLAGPSYNVSYADSGRTREEGYYLEMPVTNILRSTGKPGKITVTVFSSGLASGSCEIVAEVTEADTSFVREADLSDAGRKPVAGNTIVSTRIGEIPGEIGTVTADFSLTGIDKNGFSVAMRDYIIRNNPAADTLAAEFRTLTDLFGGQLYNNGGVLSAADYNFNASHYNTCRLISGYIERTKLPPLFKESLKIYYSELIIGKGVEKNTGDEMNWLNWIPSGGIVVIVPEQPPGKGQKGVVYAKETGLAEIINQIYPQFAKFSDDARERALLFISKMNPSVNSDYTARKGEPILIPEYKFISE